MTIAGTGALMEIYQYSAGREPDVRSGVDRQAGAQYIPGPDKFVPMELTDGVMREGKISASMKLLVAVVFMLSVMEHRLAIF